MTYSAVVLDEASHKILLQAVGDKIPQGWRLLLHHMTITLGPLKHKSGKYDMSVLYPLGAKMSVKVCAVGMDEKAMAFRVALPEGYTTRNKFPHISIAVHDAIGAKPKDSNLIDPSLFQEIEPIVVSGVVMEIPNKKASTTKEDPQKS